MQLGFGLMEAGFVKQKNATNIILKCILGCFTGVIVYYICGYAFATDLNGGVIGKCKFVGMQYEDIDYLRWIFQYSFCITSTTIVSGAIAERAYLDTYIVFTMIYTGIIYPMASGWAWGGGWLSDIGYHDFSGSGIVHLLGGTAGLVGTIILGPRIGNFGYKRSKITVEEEKQTPTKSRVIKRESSDSLDKIDVFRNVMTKKKNKNKQKITTFEKS